MSGSVMVWPMTMTLMMFSFLFFVCEFVLHLARDCIDYIRRFYSFCLDIFATRPRLRSTCWSLLRRLNTDNDSI